MLQHVHAIYENGILRPLEPLALSEHQQVWVSVITVAPLDADVAAQQRQAMEELDKELEKVNDNSPADGFTAADHDKILYGKPA